MANFTDTDRRFQQELRTANEDLGHFLADLAAIGLVQTQQYASVKAKVRKVQEQMKAVTASWRDMQAEYLKLNK